MLFFMFLVALLIYLLPSIIAISRHHQNKTAIIVLNILGGWTFIGYIIAIVWSFTNPNVPPTKTPRRKIKA